MTEQYVNADGVLIETQVKPDSMREIAVGTVTSKNPPLVKIPHRPDPVPIHARTIGLTVEVGDLVAIFRTVQGTVALAKIDVLP